MQSFNRFIQNPYSDKLKLERRKKKVQLIWIVTLFILMTVCYDKPLQANGGDWISSNKTLPVSEVQDGSKETETSKPKVLPIDSIVQRIYTLESTNGLHDPCSRDSQGRTHNGYGYAPGTCYNSVAEVQALVTKWFEKTLTKSELPYAVCAYNLGFNSPNLGSCINQDSKFPYYKNFLKLNN